MKKPSTFSFDSKFFFCGFNYTTHNQAVKVDGSLNASADKICIVMRGSKHQVKMNRLKDNDFVVACPPSGG